MCVLAAHFQPSNSFHSALSLPSEKQFIPAAEESSQLQRMERNKKKSVTIAALITHTAKAA